MSNPQDDNLIRLMLQQQPKTGKDDPLIQRSKVVNRKLSRKYKA